MERKNNIADFEFKSDNNENLIITGYASLFNIIDNYNDVISPGSFTHASSKKVKLLWQHDHTKPIGVINSLYENEKGLLMEASINCKTSQGKETASLIKQGAVDGLSIGFTVNKSNFGKDGNRIITDVNLWEISVVTFPANSGALISKIGKSCDDYTLIMTVIDRAENALKKLKHLN